MSNFQNLAQRCHFIMASPSHPGNVGSSARALKTMGFQHLSLSAPKIPDIKEHKDALALASRASDLLEQVKICPDFTSALSPVTLSFALTARSRDMGPSTLDIRQAAQLALEHLQNHEDNRIGFVLGTERTGLSNKEISHCHHICHIPANPEYSSLNVSQALQLAAWELRYALLSAADQPLLVNRTSEEDSPYHRLASQTQTEALINHWQEALEAIEFLNPKHPKKLMLKMRYWLMKSKMTEEENNMLRGVCTQILKNALPKDRP